MTIARTHLVDAAVTRWYHCATRSCTGLSSSAKVPMTGNWGLRTDSNNSRKSTASQS